MTTTATRRDGPGLRRLRANPNAETIRSAVLADQRNGRAEALARIEAEKAADPDAIDLPAAFILGRANPAAQPPADALHAFSAPGWARQCRKAAHGPPQARGQTRRDPCLGASGRVAGPARFQRPVARTVSPQARCGGHNGRGGRCR